MRDPSESHGLGAEAAVAASIEPVLLESTMKLNHNGLRREEAAVVQRGTEEGDEDGASAKEPNFVDVRQLRNGLVCQNREYSQGTVSESGYSQGTVRGT